MKRARHVRFAVLGLVVMVAALPSLDAAILGSVAVLVVAAGVSSWFCWRVWDELPQPLKIVHAGVSLQVVGTVVRMTEAALADGTLVVPSWADLIVIPAMGATIVGLIKAARARAATARLGDFVDALATSLIPIGVVLEIAYPYFTGAAPLAERATNAFFFGYSSVLLVVVMVLVYGPGVRSEAAVWIGFGGVAAVSFEFTALVGLAADATWTAQVLRVLATAVVLYAIGTSHREFTSLASPGSRPQRYRWQPYAGLFLASVMLVVLSLSPITIAVLSSAATLAVVRVIIDQTTSQRLTLIAATQSRCAADIAKADSRSEAVAAVESAVSELIPDRPFDVDVVPLPPVKGSGLTVIESVDRTARASVRSTIPGHIYVAVEQMVNLLSLGLAAIEARIQRAEEELRAATEAAEAAWRQLAIGTNEMGLQILNGTITAATPNAHEVLGRDPVGESDELVAAIVEHPMVDAGAFQDPTTAGRWLTVTSHEAGGDAVIYTIRDVTTDVVNARTDAVTGLPNQLDFDTQTAVGPGTMLMIHLHDAERLLDTAGKERSDLFIRTMAERARSVFRADEDQIWRIDGPRLLVRRPETTDDQGQGGWAERRRRQLCESIPFDNGTLSPALTVGAANVVDELPGHKARTPAETALNHALKTAPGTTVWFSDELSEAIRRAWKLESSFARALTDPAAGGFGVHYQPLVSTDEGNPAVAVEALARWVHPTLGPISPGEFIPIAEEKGLIDTIDEFVLATAIRDLADFQKINEDLRVHVNMSPTNSLSEKLIRVGKAISVQSPRSAQSLVIEITESGLGSDNLDRLVESCHQLRKLGIGIALDDFGAGQSNFDRIAKLPLTEVKFDRKLVSSWDNEFQARLLIDTFKRQGLACVAEGVEDRSTADLVTEAGADYIQGFHFARPAPAADTLEWLFQRSPRPPRPKANVITGHCRSGEHYDCPGWWPGDDLQPSDTCVCECHERRWSWLGWDLNKIDLADSVDRSP